MGFFTESATQAVALIADGDAALLTVVSTSLLTSLAAVGCASIVAIPAGIYTALGSFPGKAVLRHGLNMLMALPTVVVGLVLYGLLSRRGMFGEFGLLFSPTAMIIGQTILILPLLWNLVLTAVDAADPRLVFACRTIGANRWQQGPIFVRELRFQLIAALVMGFGRAIGEVGVAMMLGGNIEGYTRTMTTAIALDTSKGEFPRALALGMVLLGVALGINLLLGILQGRRR